MTPSEKMIEASFDDYSSAGIASLFILFPKMRAAGFLGKSPAWVQVAKAPFDVAGYYHGTGRFIACEIKESAEPKVSLPIIGPGKKGTGLQYHQLEALVNVHKNGGLACVVWDNAGGWGYLDGARLKQAKSMYDYSLRAAEKGYPRAPRGSRSILWGEFRPLTVTAALGGVLGRQGGGKSFPLWLPQSALPSKALGGAAPPELPPTDLPPDDYPLDPDGEEAYMDPAEIY